MKIEIFSDGMQRRDINKANFRVACRAIIQKEDTILIEYFKKSDVYMLPGGGMENLETEEACLKREIKEETGYDIDVVKKTATVFEYFLESTWENRYFLCSLKTTLKEEPKLTKEEQDELLELHWISTYDALQLFDSYESLNKEGSNIHSREFIGLINSI